MSNTKALTTIEDVSGTNLAQYGNRTEVRELASRMMSFHPASKEVGEDAMLAAAQLAIMSGANPLPTAGEIHIWKDWKGKPQMMLGIAYWRRKAREVDTPVWYYDYEKSMGYEPRLMNDAEREMYGVLPDELGAICKAYRYSEYKSLLELNIPWKEAARQLARSGIGIVKNREMFAQKATRYRQVGDPIDPPTGRTWAWVACKRAEQDVLRALSLINESFLTAQNNKKVSSFLPKSAGLNLSLPPFTESVQVIEDSPVVEEVVHEETLEEFNKSLYGEDPSPKVEKARESIQTGFSVGNEVLFRTPEEEKIGTVKGVTDTQVIVNFGKGNVNMSPDQLVLIEQVPA